jgi:hypothetical protein
MRFALRELSPGRLSGALRRRVTELPHTLLWNIDTELTETNREHIERLRDRHRGHRCVLMGNGPSLARMDLAPLKDEITFGLNRIYLLFDHLPFTPTYYVAVNELVLAQFVDEIRALPIPKFLNWNQRRHFAPGDPDTCFLKTRLGLADAFGRDLTKPLSSGGTVTYVALQVAYYLGFDEVILIGVDHNFADKGTPNKTEVRTQARDDNHFHPNYFPKGVKWQLPDLMRSEMAYALAREAFEQDGRRILDATVGGQCPAFEKVSFDALFPAR